MKLPIDASELIPHRGAMKLIDTFLESDGDRGVAEAVIQADSPFVIGQSGLVERCILIELAAQAYAAAKTYRDISEGKSRHEGYLVGVSQSQFFADVRAGERIVIEVESDSSFEQFYFAKGLIRQAGELVAEIMLKIWLKPEGRED